MPNVPVTAYIALGSNLGDRRVNIEAALRALRQTDNIDLVHTSSLYDNPAIGGPADSPAFLNAAAEVRTTLSPRELLQALLRVEAALGRQRRDKWEPRLIDLDLLLYGDRVIDEPELRVPHPLMHERRFVLGPLAEIAPDAVHPVFKLTIAQLLKRQDNPI